MRKERLALMFAAVLMCAASGCYHYGIGQRDRSAATEPRSETLWSTFWGLSQQSIDTTTSCAGNPIARVRTSTNLGYVLLTMATLGILAPAEVEWTCAKDPGPDECPQDSPDTL